MERGRVKGLSYEHCDSVLDNQVSRRQFAALGVRKRDDRQTACTHCAANSTAGTHAGSNADCLIDPLAR